MCLILLAWQVHPDYPLVMAANRDEFFARPTAPAEFWPEHPASGGQVLAGRDLQAGGTWLGMTRSGRFAALTNYREVRAPAASPSPTSRSRGHLVSDFLQGSGSAPDYLANVAAQAADYEAFNLLCGQLPSAHGAAAGLWYYSNRDMTERKEPPAARDAPAAPAAQGPIQALAPGIYGLSNHLLDAPWPKVTEGKSALTLALAGLPEKAPLFELLRNNKTYADKELPRTGISLDWERALSAAFIRSAQMPHYGTRSSTVLLCDRQQHIDFAEQTYPAEGAEATATTSSQYRQFRFPLLAG